MTKECQNTESKSSFFSTKYDLDGLDWTVLKFRNDKLDNKSNVLLNLFISIVIKTKKMGFRDHIGCLVSALYRKGFTISERSIYRALKTLESLGYIERRRYRVGEDRFSSTIIFNADAFAFWTRKRSEKTTPINHTKTYTTPQLTKRQEDYIPNITSHSFLDNTSKNKEPRARVIDPNKTPSNDGASKNSKRSQKNAIIATSEIVLAKSSLSPADRKRVRSTLKGEIFAFLGNCKLLGGSGIDYAYWFSRWNSMPFSQRETVFSNEFLPYLLPKKMREPEFIRSEDVVKPTKAEVRRAIEYLGFNDTVKETKEKEIEYPYVDETDPEMKILIAARDRIAKNF